MKKNKKTFDLEEFLATVNGGRSVATYRKDDVVFSQGDRCEGVFYIRHGQCKVCVISEHGKEAIVALHEKRRFLW
jgi:CRP/FNR family transcriptional regulator, cyclic AMP receptor protein